MRDCSEYDIMLSARLDGELSEDEERELEAHLAACPECRKYLRLLEAVRDGLKEDLPAPPDTLRQGIMYKVGLEKKRGRLVYGAFGRWTAIAAVICILVFGAVKLKESGLQKSAEAPAAAAESYSLRSVGSADNGAAKCGAASQEAGSTQSAVMEDVLKETKHASPVNTGMPMPAPAAPAQESAVSPAAASDGRSDLADEASEEVPTRNNELKEPDDSVYSAGSLPGYDVGRAALGDGDYRSVCIFYDALPETADTEKWLAERPGEGELYRWLVSAEELRSLETGGGWNEFYYGDLISGQGLVIVIAGEEE